MCVARNGHEGVVKIPLERSDINPDKHDSLSSAEHHSGALPRMDTGEW